MSSRTRLAWHDGDEDGAAPELQLVISPTAYQRLVKPLFDLFVGSLLLILSIPVIVIAMGVLAMRLGRPVIYRQERVGLGGRTFVLYKLRTMIPDRREGDSAEYSGPERRTTHKSPRDPRIVPVGSFIRALRLDELPQLWNVIRGDMSLVGPRPELPEIVASYDEWQHRRHTVKPGLTGLWQVSAPSDKLMHECTELDLSYIAKVSLATDLTIILRTPAAMLARRGF